MTQNYSRPLEPSPCLLIVEPDLEFGFALTSTLQVQGVKSVLANSAREALHVLRDAAFMDNILYGMLITFKLPDASGYSVVSDFREYFPGRPIAVITEREDHCLRLWTRTREIAVFRRPFINEELENWVSAVRESALCPA